MELFNTSSSLIRAYGYDAKKREMAVDFHNGGVYLYKNVPQDVFEDFLRSPSKGKYFLAHIKGLYDFDKS